MFFVVEDCPTDGHILRRTSYWRICLMSRLVFWEEMSYWKSYLTG